VDVFKAADYFIDFGNRLGEENDITNLKLNKLLYFAQGINLMYNGKNLFAEDFKAWPYGPVVEKIYNRYKKYGSNPIITEKISDLSGIIEDDEEVLQYVIEEYGDISAWKLSMLTHEPNTPWSNTVQWDIIPKIAMKEFFENSLYNENNINHLLQAKKDMEMGINIVTHDLIEVNDG
jgi:uncharacterized phage-associated protein